MNLLLTITLIAATVTMGLSAGVFFGFACAVMPGLRRCDDRTFVQTMQHVNDAILNGWFLTVFVGTVPVTAAAGVVGFLDSSPATWWIGTGLVLYLVVVGITAGVNVPLNEQLKAAKTTDPPAARAAFEAKWNRWHLVRTVAGAAGFGTLCVALLQHG